MKSLRAFLNFLLLINFSEQVMAYCSTPGCERNKYKNEQYCVTCGNALPANYRNDTSAWQTFGLKRLQFPVLVRTDPPGTSLPGVRWCTPTGISAATGGGATASPYSVVLLNPGFSMPAPPILKKTILNMPDGNAQVPESVQMKNLRNFLNQHNGYAAALKSFPQCGGSNEMRWAVMSYWILNEDDPTQINEQTETILAQLEENKGERQTPAELIKAWQEDEGRRFTFNLLEESDLSELVNDCSEFIIFQGDKPVQLVGGYSEGKKIWLLSEKWGLLYINLSSTHILESTLNALIRGLLGSLFEVNSESDRNISVLFQSKNWFEED